MKSILSSILSLIVSSSSKSPYVSHYSYDFQHGWLNIIVSEYNSQKTNLSNDLDEGLKSSEKQKLCARRTQPAYSGWLATLSL